MRYQHQVATGVGVGMCLGSLKVLFFPSALIYIILAKYSLAASLTVAASQDYTAIAWDR